MFALTDALVRRVLQAAPGEGDDAADTAFRLELVLRLNNPKLHLELFEKNDAFAYVSASQLLMTSCVLIALCAQPSAAGDAAGTVQLAVGQLHGLVLAVLIHGELLRLELHVCRRFHHRMSHTMA